MNKLFPILLFLSLFASACGIFKKDVGTPKIDPEIFRTDAPGELNTLVQDFFRVIAEKESPSGMEKYFPEIELSRVLMKKQADSLDDEEIESRWIKPLVFSFHNDVQDIWDQIKSRDISELSYKSHEFNSKDDPAIIPRLLSVYLQEDEKKIEIVLSLVQYHEQWYLFEILETSF